MALGGRIHAITQALQLPFSNRKALIEMLFLAFVAAGKTLNTGTEKLPYRGKISQPRHFSDLLASRLT